MGSLPDPLGNLSTLGHRLPIHVVDDTAVSDPERPFCYAPRSNNIDDGWEPVTFGQLANAINHVAHIVAREVKATSSSPFPTLGYVGPNDIRYLVVAFACIKAGCQALFLSPRNTNEGQLSLLDRTRCNTFWYAESSQRVVQPWIGSRKDLRTSVVPGVHEWLHAQPSSYPYNRNWREGRFDPLVVLHTSGSTGIPKPIVVRQGSAMVADGYRALPDLHGSEFFINRMASEANSMLMPMPLFHAAGFLGYLATIGLYAGLKPILGLPDQPVTPALIQEYIEKSGAQAAALPPSIIEGMAQYEDGIKALKSLRYVANGGGSVSTILGDKLVSRGVRIMNIIASTEMYPYALMSQTGPKLWAYFVFDRQKMNIDWVCHNEEERIYELRVRRREQDPLDQALFYTFPDLQEWSTGDLFQRHPDLEDHWMYYGRCDNIIVFSSGEKLNPTTIEDMISSDSRIKGAMCVGKGRFQAGIILEPKELITSEHERQKLIDDLWPLIQEANEGTVAHGRIVKNLVAVSNPDIPFPRAGKGTIQRGMAVEAYKDFIDDMYSRAESDDNADVVDLDLSTEATLTDSIIKMVQGATQVEQVAANSDFTSLGMDSLQVITMASSLRGSFKAKGVEITKDQLPPRIIYANSTPERLAGTLLDIASNKSLSVEEEFVRETKVTESLVKRYADFSSSPSASATNKSEPADQDQVIAISGTTGSLGAYLLDAMCKSPRVAKVYALNRDADGGKKRQMPFSEARGLGVDYAKVEFLQVDFSAPDFGLGPEKYSALLGCVDRVIHNAWPVNFNMGVESFEPHIRGVRHLADFSIKAAKQVAISFTSTIGSAMGWKEGFAVPEEQLTDLSLCTMGYSRSKVASSLILDAAAAAAGVPVINIRVGQVAGPRGVKGQWNKQEFIPTLIGSSVAIGMLPRSLGPNGVVDWMAIEDVANMILEVSGITVHQPLSNIHGYQHCVNPHSTSWTALLPTLEAFYSGRVQPCELSEWVARLGELATAGGSKAAEIPAIKLIDTYRALIVDAESEAKHVYFDTTRAVANSSTMKGLSAVSPDLMRNWCQQWGY